MKRVGIVIVSHSVLIADGIVELASQMAPSVDIRAAGGTDEGGIGTSFDKVTAAITDADSGAGVLVVCDIGSAIMTAEAARELLAPELRERVRIANAAIVEGTVAAAVAAEIRGDLDAVDAAATAAMPGCDSAQNEPSLVAPRASAPSTYVRTVTLINADGLHARPAAEFVRLAGTFAARVTVNGKDAKSLLGIMSLGLLKGAKVDIAGAGEARDAVDALADLIESGFGQTDSSR